MALEFLDLGLGSEYRDYQSTWDLQRAIHAEVSGCTRPDTVLLLEHSSVYTAGKRTEPQERPLDGTPVIDVDRAARSPGTGRASSSATRSFGFPNPCSLSTTCGGSRRP